MKTTRTLDKDELAALQSLAELEQRLADEVAALRNLPFTEGRWLALGAAQLQLGIMSLERAVTRPRGLL